MVIFCPSFSGSSCGSLRMPCSYTASISRPFMACPPLRLLEERTTFHLSKHSQQSVVSECIKAPVDENQNAHFPEIESKQQHKPEPPDRDGNQAPVGRQLKKSDNDQQRNGLGQHNMYFTELHSSAESTGDKHTDNQDDHTDRQQNRKTKDVPHDGVSSGLRGLFLKQPDHFRFDALVINLLTDQFLDPAVLPIENEDTGNAADL